ncbi:WD40 repeat-like protein [Nadsonia fulvescens var. elongata DSM 6958]|uniref:WD40 repeat-like protein n=1 Tax=Nadsonia fulvescens var. elongata DSM 6958 TaxID=857566 RepID=A0A1E3PJ00_9ASCO|nr:WD40 repeat-like protein [Nadsonia fulvescens var. elongata DSM 6958]
MTTVELPSPPGDLVSAVSFSPWAHTTPHLLVSSWDAQLRLYNPPNYQDSSKCLEKSVEFDAPLLDCCWSSDVPGQVFTAGLEGRVYGMDLTTGQINQVGDDHDNAIQNLVFHRESGYIVSGSWDSTMQIIDQRGHSGATSGQRISLPGKVFSMDIAKNYIVVGMSNRQVSIYDVRQLSRALQERESSLKYMTRAISCMPDGQGYASSSIEGRIAVEYFDQSPQAQAQKYAFRCHRTTNHVTNIDTVQPVNALVFHPKFTSFFSGGSDAMVCTWDYKVRKRLREYPKFPYSVTALNMDSNGSLLAIGVSNDQYKEDPINFGPRPAESKIYVRILDKGEGKPRSAK